MKIWVVSTGTAFDKNWPIAVFMEKPSDEKVLSAPWAERPSDWTVADEWRNDPNEKTWKTGDEKWRPGDRYLSLRALIPGGP